VLVFTSRSLSMTEICYLASTMHVYLHTEMLLVQQMQLTINQLLLSSRNTIHLASVSSVMHVN
jgi:hypothetical protein